MPHSSAVGFFTKGNGGFVKQKVRAAVLEDRSKIVIREFDIPDIGPEDGLLKVEMVGVCATDPKLYTGLVKYVDFPLILGHEVLGRVAKLGSKAAKRWRVKEGDRVIVEHFIPCGECHNCLIGNYRYCKSLQAYGMFISSSVHPHLWGGYSEYMYLAPRSILYALSEDVPAEAGVLISGVVSNAIRWGRLIGNFCIGDVVVIQGVGQQGLCQVIVAKESGCNPIIVTGISSDSKRFQLAKEFGADYTIDIEKEDVVEKIRGLTDGSMADVVVDVAGSTKAIQTSIDLVKNGGTLVVPTLTGTETITPIMVDKIVQREIRFQGVFSTDATCMRRAIKLVEAKKYPIEKIVSHRYSLDEARKALQTAGGYFKDVNATKCVIIP
jgi:alcohol dehydrogenase